MGCRTRVTRIKRGHQIIDVPDDQLRCSGYLACKLFEVDAHDFVTTGTARGFDADRIADFLADQRTGQW